MANNYYDMTGELILKEVTPVIDALFGDFELDESNFGQGSIYIANLSEISNISWDNIQERIFEDLLKQGFMSLGEIAGTLARKSMYSAIHKT